MAYTRDRIITIIHTGPLNSKISEVSEVIKDAADSGPTPYVRLEKFIHMFASLPNGLYLNDDSIEIKIEEVPEDTTYV